MLLGRAFRSSASSRRNSPPAKRRYLPLGRSSGPLNFESLEDRRLLALIALFADENFVDVGTDPGDEATNLKESLIDLGHTVNTFQGINEAAFRDPLTTHEILVIPELVSGDLAASLSPGAIKQISAFVSQGGGVLITGTDDEEGQAADVNFLNTVFGFSIVDKGQAAGDSTLVSGISGAEETEFQGGPGSLVNNNRVATIDPVSLPPGSRSVYQDPDENTTVAQIPYSPSDAVGQIVYLGWDWFNSNPPHSVGGQAGDWQGADGVLALAVLAAKPNHVVVDADDGDGLFGQEKNDGQSDTFKLRRDNTTFLVEMVINERVSRTWSLDTLKTITVLGSSDNDTLEVNSKDGLIANSSMLQIRFLAGAGFDRLVLTEGQAENERLDIGATNGSGRSTLEDGFDVLSLVQVVEFEGLEPVETYTAVEQGFDITSAAPGSTSLATLLGADNAIHYFSQEINSMMTGLVTVDAFEPIHFRNKKQVNLNAGAGNDTIEVNAIGLPIGLEKIFVAGSAGDDQVQLRNLPDASSTTFVSAIVSGGAGDDWIDGFEILVNTPLHLAGDSGEDILIGGAADDILNGGSGDDTLVGQGGNNLYEEASDQGFDVIVVEGTPANNIISVNQTTNMALVSMVDNQTRNDMFGTAGTIEEVRVEAGDGQDLIRVTTNDVLFDEPDMSLRMAVFGGLDNQDRLVVVDDADADLVLYRKSQSDSSGTVTVGPQNDEPFVNVFEEVEFIEFLDSAGQPLNQGNDEGRLVVFKHDPFEFNDDRFVATWLGANQTVNVDPTIDPGALFDPFGEKQNFPGDQDWYRIEAEVSGVLDLQVFFEQIDHIPSSGRPGLPGDGDLDVHVYDSGGTPLSSSQGSDHDERVRIPVVAGQIYDLQVIGKTPYAVNNYTVTILNNAPPIPYGIELRDHVAISKVDSVPSDHTFVGQTADLSSEDDFYNHRYVYFTEGSLNGTRATITDYVGATRTFTVNIVVSDLSIGDTFQVESDDTGRSQWDNITREPKPRILIRLDDDILLHDLPGNPNMDSPPDQVIPIPFNPSIDPDNEDPGYRVAVFIEGDPQQPSQKPQVPVGFATKSPTVSGVYFFDFTDALNGSGLALTDGSHYSSAKVQLSDGATSSQTGFGARSETQELVVDTQSPPVYFGNPVVQDDGLHPQSDTGIRGFPHTMNDRITSDVTPKFFGTAEADVIIRLFVVLDDKNTLSASDDTLIQIGQTVATPIDGTDQFPNGSWSITTDVDLSDLNPLIQDLGISENLDPGRDGQRKILVTAEDPAGNIEENPEEDLNIFIDTQGPRISNVTRNDSPNFTSLFDPKPTGGPDPLIPSIVIHFQDQPGYEPDFGERSVLFEDLAKNVGNYSLVGDHYGHITINDIEFVSLAQDQTAQVTLKFLEPLPDDRLSLWVSDTLPDLAGNQLDGDSGAQAPFEGSPGLSPSDGLVIDIFPTGDGEPGGEFQARFTVDSRAEIGVWSGQSVYIDTNGNFSFDPQSEDNDYTNDDISYVLGFTTDHIFSGNFAKPGEVADGFHKLAAYGYVDGVFRWLVNTDNTGVPNLLKSDNSHINGTPVAGNFSHIFGVTLDPADQGDQVGLFTGTTWHFDTNHDYQVDKAVSTRLRGIPIVGDFNHDGRDDLATYSDGDNRFEINFASADTSNPYSGDIDKTIEFGFSGLREVPVADDFDGDGIDDLGLFAPDQGGDTPREQSDWYILISNGKPLTERLVHDGDTGGETIHFTPRPFGHDLFAQFGDNFSVPVVGNFDPPVLATPSTSPATELYHNRNNALDVNGDGLVSAVDVLHVINELNENGSQALVARWDSNLTNFVDVSGDGQISPVDALLVINKLNTHRMVTATENSVTASASLATESNEALLRSVWSSLAQDEVPHQPTVDQFRDPQVSVLLEPLVQLGKPAAKLPNRPTTFRHRVSDNHLETALSEVAQEVARWWSDPGETNTLL